MPGPKYTLQHTGAEVAEAIEKAISLDTTTASKATKGSAINVATTGTAKDVATSVKTATATTDAYTATYNETDECLVLSAATVTPSVTLNTTSVTPAVANGTITPYSFEDVTVATCKE